MAKKKDPPRELRWLDQPVTPFKHAPFKDDEGEPSWKHLNSAEAYAWTKTGIIDGKGADFQKFNMWQQAVDEYKDLYKKIAEPFLRSPVDLFLHAIDGFRQVSGLSKDVRRKHLVKTWSELREADLIEIPEELTIRVGEYAGTVTEFAQQEDERNGGSRNASVYGPRIRELMQMKLPDLPFPNFFMLVWPQTPIDFSDGGGQQPTMQYEVGWLVKKNEVKRIFIDIAVTEDGYPIGVTVNESLEYSKHGWNNGKGPSVPTEKLDPGWLSDDMAVMVPLMIQWINDHREFIEDRRPFEYRKKMTAAGKLVRSPPPPYYQVLMRDDLVVKTLNETRSRMFKHEIDWQHRWGVRGHEVVKVRRGELPLDPNLEKKLRKAGYEIYTDHAPDPDGENYKRLLVRGLEEKGDLEWMAILVRWRRSYVKGPEDKPFVPSKRKSARKREHVIRLRSA